jgi:hypothetical protein
MAMINLGSISDQSLGGVITTATHGTGVNYGVISTNVRALKILLADGRTVTCSRTEESELFTATLCGLGATGLVLEVLLDVEPAFRLREVQEPMMFDDVVKHLDDLAKESQHTRLWWYPVVDKLICSTADRTYEVRVFCNLIRLLSHILLLSVAPTCGNLVLEYDLRISFCSIFAVPGKIPPFPQRVGSASGLLAPKQEDCQRR